jgi:hypothetical protein
VGKPLTMDRHEATLEDLPPLVPVELRALDLDAPSHPSRCAHISAASGVVRRGDFAYVIGDDELFLAVFRISDGAPGRLVRVFEGDLPLGHDDRKRAKPDLEVLTLLPPFERHPHGALLGLGSGSTPSRGRGFAWALTADGSLDGRPEAIDLEPLYALLRASVGELNVEGAAVMGDGLWLLQRGNSGRGANAIVELALDEVLDAIAGDRLVAVAELRGLRSYDLGRLDDAALTFSDASPLDDRSLVFTASAEATADSYADGEIVGSVVGTIGRDGSVLGLRRIASAYKVEGVHAALEGGATTLTFVCDQDDADTASPLLSATLPLDQEEMT